MGKTRLTLRQKRIIHARARGCCEYCRSQARFATHAFSIEHIVPRSRGGTTTLDNLALACQGCNNHKYTKTEGIDPVSGEQVPLFHPRQHDWQAHFTWNDNFTLIIGLTPTGRATIAMLHLNRAELVNLRRVLYALGEHPLTETITDD